MKIKTAVICAAGFGSRFLPVVKNVPKEMLPVINKPIIQYSVEECVEAGIENIIIVVREGNEVIKDYFSKPAEDVKALLSMQNKMERYTDVENVLNFKGIKIVNQVKSLPYGNGSPVISAKPYIQPGEPFAVLFADDVVLTKNKGCLAQLIDTFEMNTPDGVMAAQVVSDEEITKYASIEPVNEKAVYSEGYLKTLVEKPKLGEQPSNLASYGRFIVSYRIFDYLTEQAKGKDGEVWLQDANAKLAENGKFMFKVVDGKWYTTGDPVNFFNAFIAFMLADSKYVDEAKKILASFS